MQMEDLSDSGKQQYCYYSGDKSLIVNHYKRSPMHLQTVDRFLSELHSLLYESI